MGNNGGRKMKQKMNIISAKVEKEQVILKTDGGIDVEQHKPAEQILVDSDGFSFIYLLENNENYTYVVLPESIWLELKHALDHNLEVYIQQDEKKLPLTSFVEELKYITENIKGNSNYGEEMVEKVEHIF